MKYDLTARTAIREREQVAPSFDRENADALSTCLGDIDHVRQTLAIATLRSEAIALASWLDGIALLNAAQETLISSVHLARQRQTRDAFALLRISVETAAVAVHISSDGDALEQYRGNSNRTYWATRAIRAVRPLIPRLPEVWGALSHAAVHPSTHLFGPRGFGNCGPAEIRLFGRRVDPAADQQTLRGVSFAAALVFRATELVVLEEVPSNPGWLELPGGSMLVTASAARLVERRYEEFTTPER